MNIPIIPPKRDGSVLTQKLCRTLRWLLALQPRIRMARDPGYPWLAHGAVCWMKANLHTNMTCWEWGSGQSTVFLAKRVGTLTTIEHAAKWATRTATQLAQQCATNTIVRTIPPSVSGAGKVCSADGHEYADYADSILELPDESLDFILIDGRARARCVMNSVDKLKQGGFMLLDNSERTRYSTHLNALRQWPVQNFSNGLQRSSVYQKPVVWEGFPHAEYTIPKCYPDWFPDGQP